MSYINQNLMSDEKVVYRTRLHWIVFRWPALLLVLSFFVLLNDFATIFGLLFLGAIGWAVPKLVDFITSEFGVTNKRVVIKTGFIKRKTQETLLGKVESIGAEQSILGRILNYGTILVNGTGGNQEEFHDIYAPLVFRRKVQEQTSQPVATRIDRSRRRSP